MADEEEVEEAQPAATEFVPEASGKPKSNVYTTLLVLTFCAFFAGSWIAGNEAWQHYDVQFFGIFTKHAKAGGEPSNTSTSTSTSTDSTNKEATPPPKPDMK
jgi:hypothetical protein